MCHIISHTQYDMQWDAANLRQWNENLTNRFLKIAYNACKVSYFNVSNEIKSNKEKV